MNDTPLQILIVEDNAADYAIVEHALSAIRWRPHKCSRAATAEQASALLQQQHFDACLVDHVLPGTAGTELIDFVRQRDDAPPMILLTGAGDRNVDIDAMKAGSADFLSKDDMTPELLERSIRYAMEREQARRHLIASNARLATEIERSTRLQSQLMHASREAGRAEIAVGILHNIGNALNGVTVSVSHLRQRVESQRWLRSTLSQLENELLARSDNLGDYLSEPGRAEALTKLISSAYQHVTADQIRIRDGLDDIARNVETLALAVKSQEAFANAPEVFSKVDFQSLLEDAISTATAAVSDAQVTVLREYEAAPTGHTSPSRILFIVTNLLTNALHSVATAACSCPQITVSLTADDHSVTIVVRDNGRGIPSEHLDRLFGAGFTTRPDGQGFGLHSSILAAQSIDATLTAASEGTGQGATFQLTVPLRPREHFGADRSAGSSGSGVSQDTSVPTPVATPSVARADTVAHD